MRTTLKLTLPLALSVAAVALLFAGRSGAHGEAQSAERPDPPGRESGRERTRERRTPPGTKLAPGPQALA